MTLRSLRFVGLACVVATVGGERAAALEPGEQIAATCAACHGADRGEDGIPAIAGMDEREIVEAMRAYRAGESPSHVMHAVALSLSEDDLLAVARAVAAQAPGAP